MLCVLCGCKHHFENFLQHHIKTCLSSSRFSHLGVSKEKKKKKTTILKERKGNNMTCAYCQNVSDLMMIRFKQFFLYTFSVFALYTVHTHTYQLYRIKTTDVFFTDYISLSSYFHLLFSFCFSISKSAASSFPAKIS